MSGVAKGIGKVFKKIGKVVKKLAPVVLAVGATVLTAGALAPAIPAAAGAGLAGAAGAGLAGAGAGAAAAGGSFIAGSGILSSTMAGMGMSGMGFAGALGAGSGAAAGIGALGAGTAGGWVSSILGTGGKALAGNVIGGIGEGMMTKAVLKEKENQNIREEQRAEARYAGAGDAAGFDFATSAPPSDSAGQAGLDATDYASMETDRSSVVEPTGVVIRRPSLFQTSQKTARYRYNPESGRIEYA